MLICMFRCAHTHLTAPVLLEKVHLHTVMYPCRDPAHTAHEVAGKEVRRRAADGCASGVCMHKRQQQRARGMSRATAGCFSIRGRNASAKHSQDVIGGRTRGIAHATRHACLHACTLCTHTLQAAGRVAARLGLILQLHLLWLYCNSCVARAPPPCPQKAPVKKAPIKKPYR